MSNRPSLTEFVAHAKADPKRTLIALDVDGTISEIASKPEEARVRATFRRTLQRLAERYDLWFISGRDADLLREMVGVQYARYVGAHGLEVLDDEGLRPLFDADEREASVDRLAAEVVAELPEIGPHMERKRWSVAFHYRAFPPSSDVPLRLRSSIEAHLGTGLQLRRGKKVYEVSPALGLDKGTALGWIIDTCRPARVLAAGDDRTDIAMFRLLVNRRASGGVDCLSVAVVQREETPEDLVAAADISVQGVEELHNLLRALLPGA
jgi:trehalose-phosphatase